MITYKYSRFINKNSYPVAVKFMPVGTNVENEFHSHEFSEIVIITAGTAVHKIDGERFPVAKGDVLLIHPGCVHAYGQTKDMALLNIIYDSKMPLPVLESCGLPFISKLFPQKFPDCITCLETVGKISEEDFDPIFELARRLDYESRHIRPGKQVLILSIFMEIIIYLARCEHKADVVNKYHFTVNEIVSYMSRHYSQKILIIDLLKVAKMSERNLFRHFKSAFGVTPNEYLLHIRTQHAMDMLIKTDKQIGTIALECGFCDSNHLCNVFKKIVNMTPKEFRLNSK